MSEMEFEGITLEQSLKDAWERGKLEGAERVGQLVRGGVSLDEAIKMVKMEQAQNPHSLATARGAACCLPECPEKRGAELSEMEFVGITLEQSLKDAWERGKLQGKLKAKLEGVERVGQLVHGGVPLDEAIKMVKMEL